MSSRRKFLESTVAGIAGLTLLPSVNALAAINNDYKRITDRLKLRFAIASDGHYGQAGTDYATNYENIIKWLNNDHDKNHLDFVIINGDLVHNRPDLLSEVKINYFDKLKVPYYTIPGNHDFVNAKIWKDVFGYEDKYTIEHGDIAFILANTANTNGDYVCPDNTFIKTSLDKFSDKKVVFVVLHIPPVQWMETEKNIFLNCPETVSLLHSYPNIKAVFHGHDHLLDGVRYTGKLPHLFDAHIGGDWGTAYKGYRIIEVNDANAIYTYQVNASQNPVLNSNKL
jgi:3',5'-cyclic AMP phosphodiesterase CpdA